MGKKRSYTDEQFIQAIANNKSWRQVLFSLGLKEGGGTYVYIKNLAKKLNLSTSHMTGQGWNCGERYKNPKPVKDLEDILVEDSDYHNQNFLKKRLWREGLLKKECYVCGISDWLGTPLTLQIDHINGKRQDNRIENLQILCPNCHSQTKTFAGKNKGKSY
jgi:hypothetical protein